MCGKSCESGGRRFRFCKKRVDESSTIVYNAGEAMETNHEEDGRVDMYAEADYREGTTAYLWITNRIQMIADRIRNHEKERILASTSSTPKHLT